MQIFYKRINEFTYYKNLNYAIKTNNIIIEKH